LNSERLTGRRAKHAILSLLKSGEFPNNLDQLRAMPIHSVLTPILASLYSQNEEVKWHAVTAMGILVSHLADRDLESARDVMRRLMWSLNHESGGIGWGAPEAMGEIMARDEALAREFAGILVSYIRRDGNFLESEILQRGVIWGLSRLTEARPLILRSMQMASHLLPFLDSQDATTRGLAARTLGLLGSRAGRARLQTLLADQAQLTHYHGLRFLTQRVQDLAREALEQIGVRDR
jgi:hypothetical protein